MENQEMTPQEIMSFQGHEFTYIYSDGDTMPAYIKKIDLEKNLMSCWSFSLITDQGYEFEPLNKEEETEGACCVSSVDTLSLILEYINEIKITGKLVYTEEFGFFQGCLF